MPHATIKIWPGKTEEQKQLLAERITEVITETLEGKKESVSVSIIEVEPNKWGTEVYKNEIIGDQAHLYKAPGYQMDIED